MGRYGSWSQQMQQEITEAPVVLQQQESDTPEVTPRMARAIVPQALQGPVPSVCCVLGTYNRFACLQRAIGSAREAAVGVALTFVVVDGGSTDGSREWLATQPDVVLIGQRGELTGAVRAFNLGFAYAVDHKFDYVFHFNDDAEIVTPWSFAKSVELMMEDTLIGQVAFVLDLNGTSFDFEYIFNQVYGNYSLVRLAAGIAVANAQGDPFGRNWWNPIYRTYAADCEFSFWLKQLGWKLHHAKNLAVHDCKHHDALSERNGRDDPQRHDSVLFWKRWPIPEAQPQMLNATRKRDGIAVVLGSYNRKHLLEKAVQSARMAAQGVGYEIIVIDGGSTDGSREWLATQPDVVLIGQHGELTGAVRAFNLGFAYAVDEGFDYVFHFNDDAELVTENAFSKAIAILQANPKVGEVAFAFNLRGGWGFEEVNSFTYGNFGVVRVDAGKAVAEAQGDPSGRTWWNPIYRTYGADSEFGCWLWSLGWEVRTESELRVADINMQDDLRNRNNSDRSDNQKFWSRWQNWTGNLATAPKVVTE